MQISIIEYTKNGKTITFCLQFCRLLGALILSLLDACRWSGKWVVFATAHFACGIIIKQLYSREV